MVSKHKISIITVCYNSKDTVLDTIQSVQSQVYGNREHIIIDGYSEDGTYELLQKHRRQFDVLVSEKDQGVYDAMNKGIELATGDIIGFLNADDVFYNPHCLKTIAAGFDSVDVEAVYGNLIYVAKDNMEKVIRYWRSSSFKPSLFSKGWCPPHPTFYVRKSVYDDLGGFDLSLPIANDVELMMRFLEANDVKAKHIDEVLVRMRVGGISNNSWKNIVNQNRIILQSLKKYKLPANALAFILSKLKSRTLQLCNRKF